MRLRGNDGVDLFWHDEAYIKEQFPDEEELFFLMSRSCILLDPLIGQRPVGAAFPLR
jgi:hypothetical protein